MADVQSSMKILAVLVAIAAIAVVATPNTNTAKVIGGSNVDSGPGDGDPVGSYDSCSQLAGPACGGNCISPRNGLTGSCQPSATGGGCNCVYTPPPSPCNCAPVAGTVCIGCNGSTQAACESDTCRYAAAGSGVTCNDFNALSQTNCIWTGP